MRNQRCIGAFADKRGNRLIRKLTPEQACLRVIERAPCGSISKTLSGSPVSLSIRSMSPL